MRREESGKRRARGQVIRGALLQYGDSMRGLERTAARA